MRNRKDKQTRLIVIGAIALVVIAVIVTIIIMAFVESGKKDPYVTSDPATSSNEQGTTKTDDKERADSSSTDDSSDKTTEPAKESEKALDPATVGNIDITPLGVNVSYVKGVGGFDYQVLRTPSGSKYVEFSSADLMGTKCTDDKGVFVSILQNPAGDESATIAKTTTVDGVKYGLSVATNACTGDAALLGKYQQSFSDAFSLLKKID